MSGYYSRLNWCGRKRCLSSALDKQLKSWLLDRGSLTARLIDNCDGEFSVEVLSVKRATPTPDEIEALNMRYRGQALIRQVLLRCNGKPVIYARTIIPLSSLRGALRGLALLGSRPLGAVLFSDKLMKRKPMQVTSIEPGHLCYGWTGHAGQQRIWGRRSIFVLRGEELLVSEFFLPELFEG